MAKPLNIPLSRRSIFLIEKLLEMASNGWYTDEVFDGQVFTSPEEEEKHVMLLLRKFEKIKNKNKLL